MNFTRSVDLLLNGGSQTIPSGVPAIGVVIDFNAIEYGLLFQRLKGGGGEV